MTGSLQFEIEASVNLCTKSLTERFDTMLQATECQPSTTQKQAAMARYGPQGVVSNLLVLNVDVWPTHSSALLDHGDSEIQCLTTWLDDAPQRAGCSTKDIKDHWISLKIQVNSQFSMMDYISLWKTLMTKVPYKEYFKDVLHYVKILLVLPISAAQCQQAMSAQNRIKSSTRATLPVSTLED